MLTLHASLILFDLCLFPLFALLAKKMGKELLIFASLSLLFIAYFPLMKLLNEPSYHKIVFVRVVLITLGVAASAPFQYWAMSLVPRDARFRAISLAKAFGVQWIGAPCISITYTLYKQYESAEMIAIYISAIAAVSCILLLLQHKKIVVSKEVFARS